MIPSHTKEIIFRFQIVLPRAKGVDFSHGKCGIKFDVKVGLGPMLGVETGGDSGDVIFVNELRVKIASAEVDEGIRMLEDVSSFGVYKTAGREDGGVEGIDVVGAVNYGAAIGVILDGVGLSVGKMELLEGCQGHGG